MTSMPIVAIVLVAIALTGCSAAAQHPRIFLGPDDLPRLRSMAADTQRNALGYVPAEMWSKIQAQADRFVEAKPYSYSTNMPGREAGPSKEFAYTLSDQAPPRHDDYPHYPPWTAMFQERSDSITTRLRYFLIAYVVTEDRKYFEKAKEIVLHMSAWDTIWTDPSYGGGKPCLDTGHAATWVSIFYDWCYDSLTDAERATVRTALADKAAVPIDELIESISPYHNYTAVIANGLCMAGIALLDEDERAQGWIDKAIARATLNFDAQGEDGGALEGPMYGTYAADNFADMLWALSSAGVPNDLFEHPYIKSLPRYCISLLCPNDWRQMTFGDGGPTQGFARLTLALALRGDTDAAWYLEKIGQFGFESPRYFIALDPERIKSVEPTWNPSDAFVDIGYGILRDGYKQGPAFLAFKSGPPTKAVGHNHFDHNSFTINYAGQWIAWDPGYRSYFNPPKRRYTSGSIGHSTILLDLDEEYLSSEATSTVGHDQVSVTGGRISELYTSEGFDYLMGQAADTYNTTKVHVLDRFDRQIVFAKPGVFFIRDTLAAPEEHTYSFMLHTDLSGTFEIDGEDILALGSSALLQARVFSPGGVRLAAASYPGAEEYGPYVSATTEKTQATTITSVLVPRHFTRFVANPGFESGKTGWQPRNAPGFVENHVIDTDEAHSGEASARIDTGGYYYSSRFALPPGTKITARWWAKCTAKEGASSMLYYWKGGRSFANTPGPIATVNEWTQYEMTDVVPEGTESICLALQFFGEGQCWYDDVEIIADYETPQSDPAVISALGDESDGAVVDVDGVTHVLLCGEAGERRTFEAAGHEFEMDGELAVVSFGEGEPAAFLLRGSTITVDGVPVAPTDGEWKTGPVE